MKPGENSTDLTSLLDAVARLAGLAGEKILMVYDSEFAIDQKEDRSPLTAADLASHHAIVEGLRELTPGVPILSEESSTLPYAQRSLWQRYWLVDPLDGTKEFIKRNGEFTVNIALIEGGTPSLGVVHVPVSGVSYLACRGCGARKHEPGREPIPIKVRKLPDGPVMVVGSRSHRGDSLNRFLENLGEYEMVGMGSSLKLCLVAEGSADVYPRLGPTSEWDTAAAQCVVEQAGGHVTDTDMQPLRYNTKDFPVEKFYRDAKLCTIGEGTTEIQKVVISRAILK